MMRKSKPVKPLHLSVENWELVAEALYDLKRNSVFDEEDNLYVDNPAGVAFSYSEKDFLRLGKILNRAERHVLASRKKRKGGRYD